MAKRRKSVIPGASYSLKRAVGITSAKRKIAKATGIPTTRSGRQRKAARMMGCLMQILIMGSVVVLSVFAVLFIFA